MSSTATPPMEDPMMTVNRVESLNGYVEDMAMDPSNVATAVATGNPDASTHRTKGARSGD